MKARTAARLILLTLLGATIWVAIRMRGTTRGEAAPAPQTTGIRLDAVVTDLDDPVHLTAPAGDPRLFIVEQAGRIRLMKDGHLLRRPWLDIADRVGSGGERGLLSLAFHPRFRDNGRFFVNYTDRSGHTHVMELHAAPASDTADTPRERQLLFVRQPYANHNGGHILFGPDGLLYVGMGDGGAGGDPQGNGQDPRSQLGKLLTIDVEAGTVAIRALGLRNPWRMAFDSGLIYIADVGQGSTEEINVQPATATGLNYGWRTMEGSRCFLNPVCRKAGLVLPTVEYDHGNGCSVIGGYVYRGRAMPALAGHYFYSDYCNGWLRSFKYLNGAATDGRQWTVGRLGSVLSFGEDGNGELYLLSGNGTVYRLAGQ